MARLFGTADENKPSTPTAAPKAGRLFNDSTPAEPSKPTIGGQLIRGATKPFVRYLYTVGLAGKKLLGGNVTEEDLQPVHTDYYGDITPVGTQGTTGQRIKDVAGNLAEVGSFFVGGGAAKSVGKTALLQLAKEGAIAGGVGAAGAEMQNPESTLGSVAKAGATGAVGGAVLGPAVGMLGKGVGRLFKGAAPKAATAIEGVATKAEVPVVAATEKVTAPITKEVGHDIRTVMEGLSDAGFNKDQISKTMQNLYEARPNAKRFTDKEIIEAGVKTQPGYYEGYTPNEQLPTIGFDQKTKSTVTPKQPTLPTTEAPEGPLASTNTAIKQSNQVVNMPKTAKGSTVAKASSDINRKLVNAGFDSLPAEEQARFNSVTRSQQVNDISNLADYNMDKVIEMGKTGKGIPTHIDPQILFNFVRNHAQETGDTQLLLDLAKSPIASQRAILAQKLGAAATLTNENDPIALIQEVEKARTNPVKVEEEFKGIKQKVESAKIEKPTFEQFIKSIEC